MNIRDTLTTVPALMGIFPWYRRCSIPVTSISISFLKPWRLTTSPNMQSCTAWAVQPELKRVTLPADSPIRKPMQNMAGNGQSVTSCKPQSVNRKPLSHRCKWRSLPAPSPTRAFAINPIWSIACGTTISQKKSKTSNQRLRKRFRFSTMMSTLTSNREWLPLLLPICRTNIHWLIWAMMLPSKPVRHRLAAAEFRILSSLAMPLRITRKLHSPAL